MASNGGTALTDGRGSDTPAQVRPAGTLITISDEISSP